jgi:mono/diheme cytochrome c family protein
VSGPGGWTTGRTLTLVVLAAVLFAAIWWGRARLSGSDQPKPIAQADAATIAAGKPLYERHCASCHGANLEGQPSWRERRADGRLPAPPHDDSGHTWHHPDEVLIAITRRGLKPPLAPDGYQSDMPGFEGVLTEAEIRAVLAWIASRWSAESRAHQLRITRGN